MTVADGTLVLVDLSGHTAGQVGMFVNLPSGKRLFLIGDTSWTERGVEQNKPRPVFVQWISHVDSDRERNSEQLKRIHELHQRDPELLIVPAHDEVVAAGLALSLDKPLEWAVGFFFGNVELSLELWTVISGISGFDD